jgi:hypothetical protein
MNRRKPDSGTPYALLSLIRPHGLAGQPFEILQKIEDNQEYLYHDDSPNHDQQRWSNFLLDSGLIEPRREKTTWLSFDREFNGKNISEFAKTTPAGHILVSERRKRGF